MTAMESLPNSEHRCSFHSHQSRCCSSVDAHSLQQHSGVNNSSGRMKTASTPTNSSSIDFALPIPQEIPQVNKSHAVPTRQLQHCEGRNPKSVYSFSGLEKLEDHSLHEPKNCILDGSLCEHLSPSARCHEVTAIVSNGAFLILSGLCFIGCGSYGLILVNASEEEGMDVFQQGTRGIFLHPSRIVSYAFLFWGILFAHIGAAFLIWVFKIIRKTPSLRSAAPDRHRSTRSPVKPPKTSAELRRDCGHSPPTHETQLESGDCNSSSHQHESQVSNMNDNPGSNKIQSNLGINTPPFIHRFPTSHQISIPLVTVIV